MTNLNYGYSIIQIIDIYKQEIDIKTAPHKYKVPMKA